MLWPHGMGVDGTTLPSRIETNRICVSRSGTELTLFPPADAATTAGNFSVTSDKIASISTSYDYLITLLLCGDCGVGKTSMLRRYISDEMNDDACITTAGMSAVFTSTAKHIGDSSAGWGL